MPAIGIRREFDVEGRISEILRKFEGQKFNDVVITKVVRQYEISHRDMGTRKADIAVLIESEKPLILIETKKKYEAMGYRVLTRFMVWSKEVVGQVFAYAAILKKNGVHVPFVATANDAQIEVFEVPEDIDEHVNWEAVKERNYGEVLPTAYWSEVLRRHVLRHTQIKFTEDFFKNILEDLTAHYTKKHGAEEKRQEPRWILIEELRGFVDYLTPFIKDAIAPNGKFRDDIAKKVEEYAKQRGYWLGPTQLAREMAYVLMNKIIFYKILERYYNLERLKPLYREGVVNTVSSYLTKLRELFERAVKVTGDFEPIFKTGIYDDVDMLEGQEVIKTLDDFIELIEGYRIERFGDIVGYVFEDLIPAEERHELGQFYTPKPIAELIVKWAVRSPDDKVLDPGCGSGTFLIEAYKRLAELKLKRPFHEIKYVKSDVHRQILDQLVGIDIDNFAVHLTMMNLAMRNPRAPSTNIKVVNEDFFTIIPRQIPLSPYKVKTLMREQQVEIVFMDDFDVVVGNPPYTRWGEIPEKTQKNIIDRIGDILEKYDLKPQAGRRGAEYTMVIFWLIHATNFLKEGGRLGMIVSNSWLQTSYGIRFGKYLTDHYKIHAIIDISARVFPVPSIGSCIVLLEKSSNEKERNDNNVVFAYLNIGMSSIDIDKILDIIMRKQPGVFEISGSKIVVKVYKQKQIKESNVSWINFIFDTKEILEKLATSNKVVKLSEYFEPSYGNTLYTYLYTKRIVKTRHAGIGGEDFFYLTADEVKQYGLPNNYVYPLLSSPKYMPFFTFTKEDWLKICQKNSKCYLLLVQKPKYELPPEVLAYIRHGEEDIVLKKGNYKGEPVSRSKAAEERKRLSRYFIDWYDLGGVLEAPIYVARGVQYWFRFVLSRFNCALDDRILALIPRQGVNLDEVELKALLAFLNSSFGQLQAEVKGRSTGRGMIELDVKPLSEFLVLDVKKLPRDAVERLASLFDKLEETARLLGGADSAENVFGSELAKELTGRGAGRGVQGLFNTVIKEIDYEVAKILGLEDVVEYVRALVLDLIKRRVSRAGEAKPGALKGSEEYVELKKPKRGRGEKKERLDRRLDEFF